MAVNWIQLAAGPLPTVYSASMIVDNIEDAVLAERLRSSADELNATSNVQVVAITVRAHVCDDA